MADVIEGTRQDLSHLEHRLPQFGRRYVPGYVDNGYSALTKLLRTSKKNELA